MISNFNYYDYKKKTVVERIMKEISFYEECQYSQLEYVQAHVQYLKDRIGIGKEDCPKTEYFKPSVEKIDITKYIKDMDSIVFKCKWEKLKDIHKTIKLKEYVANLKYSSFLSDEEIDKNRDKVIKDLIADNNTKRTAKNKIVSYDEENMQIISISGISKNKNGLYVFKTNS